MGIASRTPEGDAFSCRVCGAVDLLEPSPLAGDAVCPRCGGYLMSALAGFDDLLGGPEAVTLDTDLNAMESCDIYDIAERLEALEQRHRWQVDWQTFQECRTVEDLVRFLASVRGVE